MGTIEDITSALQDIQERGGEENFVIFSAGDYYVQFACQPGDQEIYGEAVSSEYLPGDLSLSRIQVAKPECGTNCLRVFEKNISCSLGRH